MDECGWTIYRVAKETDIIWNMVSNMFMCNTELYIVTIECICKGMGMMLPQFYDGNGAFFRIGKIDSGLENILIVSQL